MPYKDPKKQAEYMRKYRTPYMRVYRKSEKVKREAENKANKLNTIKGFLIDKYVWFVSDKSELMVQPKVTRVPQITLKRDDTVAVKVNGEEVPMYEEKPLEVGTAKKVEGVPKDLKPIVNYVQETCRAEGVLVSEICVKRDIEFYLTQSFSDLIAHSNFYREQGLAGQWYKLLKLGFKINDERVVEKVAEWRRRVKAKRDARDAFDRFVMVSMLAGRTDDEILSGAQIDKDASKFFLYHIEDQAKIVVKEIKEILRPEESTEDEILGKMTPEERDYALEALKTEATARSLVAAKRLVDEKNKRKFIKQPRKKKKTVYHVTVDE